MKLLNKTRLSVAMGAVALLSATAAHGQLKIGHIASMSGVLAALGADQYDGFMMRVDEGGGMLGGQKVEVVRVDGQSKPDVGLQAARELVEREDVDIVVGMTASNVINAVLPYVVKNEVPLIGTNGGPSPFA